MPKFAANLSMLFTEVDFLDRFEMAAKAGFKGVEFLFPYGHPAAEIKERLDGWGLDQVLFNTPAGDWEAGERGLAALPGREAEFRDGVARASEYALALGCAQVHLMSGVAEAGASGYMDAYLGNLEFAAETLSGHGIGALIEPINNTDMPGYFLNLPAQARAVIEDIGHPNLFMQLDVYHAKIMGEDPARAFQDNLDLIRHMQIAGVPERHEPDQGDVDYASLFALIDSSAYEGWIGCEYRPRAGTLEGLSWAGAYGIG
jgi:hydroxypyruvate isomerase